MDRVQAVRGYPGGDHAIVIRLVAPRILGVSASQQPGGKTTAGVAAVLAGAARSGCSTEAVELSGHPLDDTVGLMASCDAVVFGSPVYRATYSASLKQLLEHLPRGRHGETTAPLRGKCVATVLTGATAHHFRACDDLRNVLASFFASQVLSPGLYIEHADFALGVLSAPVANLAAAHGAALADLASAIRMSPHLRSLEPLV